MTQSFPGWLVPQTSPSLLFAWGSVLALNKNDFLFNSPMKEADPYPPPPPPPPSPWFDSCLSLAHALCSWWHPLSWPTKHTCTVVLRWKGKTIVYKWKGCSTPWCFTRLASRRIQVWDVCLPAFLFPQLCCGQCCLSEWLCPGRRMTNTTATRLTESLWWSGCHIGTSVPATTFAKVSVSLSGELEKQSICVSLLFGEWGGRLPRFCSCVLKEKVPFLI